MSSWSITDPRIAALLPNHYQNYAVKQSLKRRHLFARSPLVFHSFFAFIAENDRKTTLKQAGKERRCLCRTAVPLFGSAFSKFWIWIWWILWIRFRESVSRVVSMRYAMCCIGIPVWEGGTLAGRTGSAFEVNIGIDTQVKGGWGNLAFRSEQLSVPLQPVSGAVRYFFVGNFFFFFLSCAFGEECFVDCLMINVLMN